MFVYKSFDILQCQGSSQTLNTLRNSAIDEKPVFYYSVHFTHIHYNNKHVIFKRTNETVLQTYICMNLMLHNMLSPL